MCGGFLRGAAVMHSPAGLQNQHVVAHQGHIQFVQHAHHRFALCHQILHPGNPVGLMRGVQMHERFIHQQQIGLGSQGPRQQHPLAFAARELPQQPIAPRPGAHGVQGLLYGLHICV